MTLSCVLVQDPDITVRERAASCLTVIGRKVNGVRKILSSGALITLLDLLQDDNLAVRYAEAAVYVRMFSNTLRLTASAPLQLYIA